MAINRTSPKKGKVVDIPTVPTIGSATAGGESATVAYTAATIGGPATTFTALSNPGSITGTGSSSPITVSGLTAGTAYTFTVRGNNATGSSEYSSASNSITPTVVSHYESIATTTVGAGGSSSITFSSIPSTYKHLQIRALARGTRADAGDGLILQFNGDTASNYSSHNLYGNGSAVSAGVWNRSDIPLQTVMAAANATSGIFGTMIVDILEYTNTNIYKTTRTLCGNDRNGSGDVTFQSGNWRNTNAVTSIVISPLYGSGIAQYSHFALYGIKGA